MKILVLGGTGQVGFEVRRSVATLGEVVSPDRTELPLNDFGQVRAFLDSTRPDVIVNAAAWTAVDAAEDQKDEAYLMNSELPRLLASFAESNHALLVHYSSDYVYPGDGTTPWTESSPTRPLSIYGSSKLQGDNWIQESNCRYLIFRTSWIYSARGSNFFKTMLRLAKERDEFNIVDDQIGAPTPARLIADITANALAQHIRSEIDSSVYNLCARGAVSWLGFAEEIFGLARSQGMMLAVFDGDVTGVPSSEYITPAQRPLNSRMDLTKLESTFGIRVPSWESQLELVFEEYISVL